MHSRASIALIASALFAGVAGAQSFQPVEWKVSDGGNGHWYAYVQWSSDMRWWEARDWAVAHQGHLATLTTAAEDVFVTQLATSRSWPNPYIGPWLGAYATNPCSQGASCFQWVTGEPFSYTRWHPGNPDDVADVTCPGVTGISLWDQFGSKGWQDLYACHQGIFYTAIVEWDTDCNGDGIVDYGQIQSGQLQDDNQNDVPDVCESTVTGVIPVSGASSGGTSVIINGTNFPQNPTVLIGGSAATNVVRVSANRITAVTPAGLPGMTSVAVGNWVQPNAFYYRPECGSDLDQDGEVTAADIAIVLLDFGPCYVAVNDTQQEDSTPFMLREQPAPVAPQSN